MSVQKTHSSEKEIAEIWKMFRESREEMRLISKEAKRRAMEEDRRAKEADRRAKEADRRAKEADRRAKEADRRAKKEADQRAKEADRRAKKEADRRARKEDQRAKKEADRRAREEDQRAKEAKEAKLRLQHTERIVQETAAQMKNTDRRLDRLDYLFTGHWGKLMEALTAGGLRSALKERNIQVTGVCSNAERIYKNQKREFDIIATNGEELVVVEVKTTLKLRQVQLFLKNIKSFKNYFPEYKEKIIYGAMAYLKSNEGASGYAEKKGLLILNPVGNIVKVVNSERFRPKQMA